MRRKQAPYWVVVAILLAACQTDPGGPPRSQIQLHLSLPEALKKHSARYSRFLERVVHLRISAQSKQGYKNDFIFPPDRWDRLQLEAVDFPKATDDYLDIHIQVWDRRRDGAPRTFPVLLGKKRIGGPQENGDNLLKLSLQVSVEEYDR